MIYTMGLVFEFTVGIREAFDLALLGDAGFLTYARQLYVG